MSGEENPILKGLREAIPMMIAYREYGEEENPPSLARIRSMLRECPAPSGCTAEDILRGWHWNKMQDSTEYWILSESRQKLTRTEPSWQQFHEVIEDYLESATTPFDEAEIVASFRENMALNNISPGTVDEQQVVDHMREFHNQRIQNALHTTPDKVAAVYRTCREYNFLKL